MSDTHTWSITILGTTTIGEIVFPPESPSSTFALGPFPPHTNEPVASLVVKNTGDLTGNIDWRLYCWPGVQGAPPPAGCPPDCGVEYLLQSGTFTNVPAGGTSSPLTITQETSSMNPFPLGIKVKGATEVSWPTWGMGLNTNIWGEQQLISNNALIIGVGMIGLIGLLWYTKKKHMW